MKVRDSNFKRKAIKKSLNPEKLRFYPDRLK